MKFILGCVFSPVPWYTATKHRLRSHHDDDHDDDHDDHDYVSLLVSANIASPDSMSFGCKPMDTLFLYTPMMESGVTR